MKLGELKVVSHNTEVQTNKQVNFTLQPAMKAHVGNKGTALLSL
jgi:hypothetical protein